MHTGGVQRVVAAGDAQKARRLLKGFVPKARHFFQFAARADHAVGVAEFNNVVGQGLVQTGHARQQRRRGGVHFHAHGVHTVFHHGVQLPCELGLGYVVLVLAHTNGFRIDFHQFRQRVLEATGDGNGTANGDVQVRKFFGGKLGGRVHRGTGLVYHHALGFQVAVLFQHVLNKFFGFPGGSTVADGDQLHIVLFAQRDNDRFGFSDFELRRGGENGAVINHLAGGVYHGHFHPGAQARVQADGGFLARRCGQQQVFHIGGKHLDRGLLGHFPQLTEQVGFQVGQQLHPPGPAHHLAQPLVPGPALVANLPVIGHHGFAGMGFGALGLLLTQRQRQVENAFVAAPKHGQRAMRGHALEGLIVLKIIPELLYFLGLVGVLTRRHSGAQVGFVLEEVAQLAEQLGVFAEALHQDVLGAIQCGLGVVDLVFGVQVFRGFGLRIQARIPQQRLGQGLQARLDGDLALGATLGLVG